MKRRVFIAYCLFAGLVLGAVCFFPGQGSDNPDRRRPLILAHRGLMDAAPENSIASIREALEAGADGSEIDVHLAGSGEVVVLHDPSVNRVSDGHGFVKDLTLEEIKAFRLDPDPKGRYTNERIPTLEEMLRDFGRRAVLFIEMKRPGGLQETSDGLEEKVGAVINRLGLYDTTYVSSFNPLALSKIKKAFPGVRTVLEYHQGREGGLPRTGWLEAAGPVHAIGPSITIATKDTAAWARERGYRLSTFSPRTLDELEKAIELGCDLITTSRPELCRMVLEGRLRPEGLEKIPPLSHITFEGDQAGKIPVTRRDAYQGRAAMELAVNGERGAVVELPVKPEALYLLMFHVKVEGGLNDEQPISRIYLIERNASALEPGEFMVFDADRIPGGQGGIIRQGPPLFGGEAARDGRGWMRIRFAFRTGHDTRSLRLILGAAGFHGNILVDALTLRGLE